MDSLYARNQTLVGIWLPRKGRNIELVRQLRSEWRQVQIRRGRHAVRIEHVRSHTVPGNELADKLAERGLYLDEKDPIEGSEHPLRGGDGETYDARDRETGATARPPAARCGWTPASKGRRNPSFIPPHPQPFRTDSQRRRIDMCDVIVSVPTK